MVEKCGWGFLEGRNGKEKWKEKNEIESEMKINGDGYGKNKLVEEKIGIMVEFT